MTSGRLILFIDAQNFYRGSRRAFFNNPNHYTHYTNGQIKPMELGSLICQRQLPDIQASLEEVRVYTGRPDASKEPRTYAAHMKQCNAWEKTGATVIHRAIKYPPDWPASKAEEKGIDVQLSTDFVAFAIDRKYEIGVIASTDTDLVPALEYVYHKCSKHCCIQVAAWTSAWTNSRLSMKDSNIWCHWLNRAAYDAIADLTNYNI